MYHLEQRARRRAHYTGEGYQTARAHLLAAPGCPPIPGASPAQAELEAAVLLKLGRVEPVEWRPGDPAYGINCVSPRVNEISIRLRRSALPDFICAVLPRVPPDESDCEGVAGLRTKVTSRSVQLTRFGRPGLVKIDVNPSEWRSAVSVAREWDPAYQQFPWLDSRSEITSIESKLLSEQRSDVREGLAVAHRAPSLASNLLRRINVLRASPHAQWFDLWPNYFDDGVELQLEWLHGPHLASVIQDLQDPVYGLGYLAPNHNERLRNGFHRVNILSHDEPSNLISLRRNVSYHRGTGGRHGNDLIQRRVALRHTHGL
jgi:hypothetical protein